MNPSSSSEPSSTLLLLLSSQLQSFWFQQYNPPNSWLPLFVPTTLWVGLWCYARLYKNIDFARWYKVHTIHHVGAISLATCSLYFNNNDIFNERIGILWSFPYFVVDIIECIYMNHILYVAHGLSCAILGLCNYNVPLLHTLRMNSKASYIESSSIILYQVKQHRQPWLFVIFAMVYTCCRIVWVPIMGIELIQNGMEYTNIIFLLLVAFYGLQIHWWIKIINILIKEVGGGGGGKNTDDADADGDATTTTKKKTKGGVEESSQQPSKKVE